MLPELYAIVDVETLARRGLGLREFAVGLAEAGVTLVQLRDKVGSPADVLDRAAVLRECLPGATLIMNDRVDLAVLAGFDGVHVGQGDLGVEDAREVLGGASLQDPGLKGETWGTRSSSGVKWVGVSTHCAEEVVGAAGADYVAVGPVFGTVTKLDASSVVGLDGVRMARGLTSRPLVAIGGITLVNCCEVLAAGADSVAVISGLMPGPGETVAGVCREWLRVLKG